MRAVLILIILAACLPHTQASEPTKETENTPKYLCSLGVQALKLGQFDQAIGRFQQALKKDSKYFYAHINIALAYQQKNELDKLFSDSL